MIMGIVIGGLFLIFGVLVYMYSRRYKRNLRGEVVRYASFFQIEYVFSTAIVLIFSSAFSYFFHFSDAMRLFSWRKSTIPWRTSSAM